MNGTGNKCIAPITPGTHIRVHGPGCRPDARGLPTNDQATFELGKTVNVSRIKSAVLTSATVAALAAPLIWTEGVSHAASTGSIIGRQSLDEGGLELGASRSLIREIQRRLAEIGLYSGSVDGQMSPELRAAIENYEEQSQLPVTGQPSQSLKRHLDDAGEQARRLLRRLEAARLRQIEEARGALSGDARTVDLMNRGTGTLRLSELPATERERCARTPDENCLVAEALEALVGVTDSEQRDWVLGRLATFQALRGDQARALGLMLRISDPRLIVEGLKHVAWGMAVKGEMVGARETTAAIPLPRGQAEALLDLSVVAVRLKQGPLAVTLVDEAVSRAPRLKKTMDVIDLNCRAARLLAAAGETQRAKVLIDASVSMTADLEFTTLRDVGFHRISRTLLDINDVDAALVMAKRISTDSHLGDVALADIVSRLREDGKLKEAADRLVAIRDPARIATAMVETAASLGRAGDVDMARQLVDRALRRMENVRPGVTLDRVRMGIAIAATEMNDGDMANSYLELLEDKEIGARTAWVIARIHARAGRVERANALRQRAETIAGKLDNPFDRTWVTAELALLAREDDPMDGTAQRLLQQAIEEARNNETAWFRARALARVAIARMMIFSEPEQFLALRNKDQY